MSKPALLFLLLTLISGALLWIAPEHAGWLASTAKVLLVVCSLSLVIALLVGKRVKFDPVLR
ncbi:PA3371 family protein [Phytopseudomonas dryadis]|uniref:Uncharacterized protein n=1 Tax=Phytopseudomonas dryadis TaxID=2487520 RepID=A0A4Q9R2Y1_9GAMM|nr:MULTISPECIES: PA3371 family protein [Pseudomonas]TBU93932.1 hypothetical protein DNK44_09655 [Pseudomonas dryadis]TBV07906.1 hypothetical protein DNK34_06960 [Pseudomonas dryadis]TBV19301.1 hypothetical protein DNK41_04145 [Pseudomonas sp. FRB 230]